MEIEKITTSEREALKDAMYSKICNSKRYRKEVFKLVFNDDVKSNMVAWKKASSKKRRKVSKIIYKYFDSSFITYATSIHGRFKPKQILKEVAKLKDRQLKEFGVRK